MKSKELGFSLIELSIILTIASVVIVGVISANKDTSTYRSNEETIHKLKVIRNALIQHYKKWDFLPCPASGLDNPSSSTYGEGTLTNVGYGCSTGNTFEKDGPGAVINGEKMYIGSIPFAQLGLPSDYMVDAWSNKIMYISQKAITHANGRFTKARGVSQLPATLLIANKYNNAYNRNSYSAIPNDYHEANAKFVLISHGPSGVGAYKYNGGAGKGERNRGVTSNATGTNHHAGSGMGNDYTLVFLKPTEYIEHFDDLVEYW